MNCIKFSGVVTIDQLTICNGSDMYGIRCCVMVHYTLNVPCWDYTSLKIEQIKDNLGMLLTLCTRKWFVHYCLLTRKLMLSVEVKVASVA